MQRVGRALRNAQGRSLPYIWMAADTEKACRVPLFTDQSYGGIRPEVLTYQ